MNAPIQENFADDLDVIIDWFKIKKYAKTEEWLKVFKSNDEQKKIDSDFKNDFQEINTIYTIDVEKKGGYDVDINKLISKILGNLMEKGIDTFSKSFEEVYPFIQDWRRT